MGGGVRMTYRSRSLLDLAHRVNECQMGIPGVCEEYSAHGCEPAHGPKSWLSGGIGCKSDDIHAASCHSCHVEIDQGKTLSRDERQWYWGRAAARTWALYLRNGWLKVSA